MTTTQNPGTRYLDTLKSERAALLTQARDLIAAGEKSGRGLSPTEAGEFDGLLAEAGEKNEQINRFESLAKTGDQIAGLMDGDPMGGGKAAQPGTGRGVPQSRFAKSISRALFGEPAKSDSGIDLDDSGMQRSKRVFFDNAGNPLPAPSSPFSVGNGRTTIPVGRTRDGGDVVLLPEFGGTLLGLLNKPKLLGGDAYRFHRQTTRTDDAAQFVPKHGLKPTAPFGFEVIDDRVRTLAVLSDPMALQDLSDVPSLATDVGNELANRIIWRLEDAIINGEQTETDDAGREMFDGILATTGVREQPYFNSPFRTIRRSLSVLEVAGHDPESLTIALNPLTWEALETETDATGRPLFAGLYTARQEPILFGRPVALSNKIAEGDSIVGQWTHAMATLRTDIELSWSDGGDNFSRNQVRFRADLRAGFNLSMPSAFVHATLEPTTDGTANAVNPQVDDTV